MFYEAGNISPKAVEDISIHGKQQHFGVIDYDESDEVLKKLGINYNLADMLVNSAMTYENHEGFDFICVNILNHKSLLQNPERVFIFVTENMLLFVCKNISMVENVFKQTTENIVLHIGFERILCLFFENISVGDMNFLEEIELEISNLENSLITSNKNNCVIEIVSLRKRLMVLKNYYEQLLNLLDELIENENDFMSKTSLRHFKIYDGKVDRNYHNSLNLRDYVTQVREAYQAQVDIGLNDIMKTFTVLTAVFLPLTLLVGWYGMNLKMPEYHWAFGYPAVFVVSVAIVAFCLFYFKRHKWF